VVREDVMGYVVTCWLEDIEYDNFKLRCTEMHGVGYLNFLHEVWWQGIRWLSNIRDWWTDSWGSGNDRYTETWPNVEMEPMGIPPRKDTDA
jgi:hypothetical protein